ncbi:MAG: KH domain-containing protein [Candidatus Hydrothermarchaeota archaeon]
MRAVQHLIIPKERVGVVIGKNGKTKAEIEEKTDTRIILNTETGEVTIELKEDNEDPFMIWKARDIIYAIGRGFSPERAKRLLDTECILEVIDITQFSGRSQSGMKRLKGRVIGKEGKARKTIEEYTGVDISVYGKTISLIGYPHQVSVARRAVLMLLEGAPHQTVYRFLESKRKEIKVEEMYLWER